jgi:hypothetical protein
MPAGLARYWASHRRNRRPRYKRNRRARYHYKHHRNRRPHYVRGHYSRNRRPRYKHHRNRYRRNRAVAASGGFALMRPMTWAPQLMTLGIAGAVSAVAPRVILGPAVTPNQAYLVQAGVAVGGAIVLPMFLRRSFGFFWFLGSLIPIVTDAVVRYLFPVVGLAAYPYEAHAALSGVGQQPYYPPTLSDADGMGYYPGRLSAYEPVPGALAPFDMDYGQATRIGGYWNR